MSGPLVVVGDTVLDRDVDGTVDRLCPDAPAPVLDERSATDRPGGAGLAALLAAADGHDVVLVTALADDPAAARLAELLTAAGVRLHPMSLPGATPEKIRLRADGQVLLRLDRGGDTPPCGEPSAATLRTLAEAGAILVSDYGRGVARQPALRRALAATSAPVIWDPHPRGPAAVPGTRLLTPNEGELFQLTGDAATGSRLSGVARSARTLRDRWRAAAVAVTLGGDGSLLCHNGGAPLVVPSPVASAGDTCGAGDRFASAAALALANGALVSEAVEDAVRVASAYVAAGGPRRLPTRTEAHDVAPTRIVVGPAGDGNGREEAASVLARVRANGGTVVATGGCFDLLHTGHLATLQAARRLGDCLVVCLNSDRSVAELKGPGRPLTAQVDRARLLAALDCVDAVVIFDEPTPDAVLSWLRPDIWVKGGDYARGADPEHPDLPETEQVRRWGGQVVFVPYLDGRSTSSTIAAARAGGRQLTEGRR
ncbi:bifunctional heptose 7-phosphate kinase/heptose 1-phosphate adenyltransferase [Micromonospora noduli]|uniref:PfkB family carbohydrate kinase n=1 Tax=Micromonospora noduli TaxID=709876 RepID=UPI00124AED38|nr:PfkB family carbohydrate kinase [Micromonospora noduli]KAB1921268.1 bifunctional heptose 7-phosphate kinase/heptose 1-phosphate adenyltransferase [Micromonospora noduli]